MPSSSFRATDASSLSRVAGFLQTVFSSPASSPLTGLDFLNWKYLAPRPDWSGPRSYVLESGGDITAHGAAWPLTLITHAGRHAAFNFIDWAADPRRPGAGVAILQRMVRLGEPVIVLGGSEMARKILPAVGFKESSPVHYFARPLRPFAQAAARPWRRDFKAPARLARNVYLRLAPPLRAQAGWSLDPVHPRELAALLRARDDSQTSGARFARSPEQIDYYLQCPIVQSIPYVLRHGQEAVGYALITYAARQARIVDAWVSSKRPEDWKALFAMCQIRALECPDTCEIVTLTSNQAAATALKACGFLLRNTERLKIFRRGDADPTTGAGLLMQMLDCDVCFRHDGRAQFWT